MATELTDPDNDDILEFTETVEDIDGDSLAITLELDEINGNTQSGSDRNPSWLSFTTNSTLSNGERNVDVNISIDTGGLGGAGSTYKFKATADDGYTTVPRTFTLSVVTATVDSEFAYIVDMNNYEIDRIDISDGTEDVGFYGFPDNSAFWPLKKKSIHVASNGDVLEVDPQDATTNTLFSRSYINNNGIYSAKIGGDMLLISNGDEAALYKLDGTVFFEGSDVFGGDGLEDIAVDKGSDSQFVTLDNGSSVNLRLYDTSSTLLDSESLPSYTSGRALTTGKGIAFIHRDESSNISTDVLIKYDISGGSIDETKRIEDPLGDLDAYQAFFNTEQERLAATFTGANEKVGVYDIDLNLIWSDDFLNGSLRTTRRANGPGVHMLEDGIVAAYDKNGNVVVYEKDGTRKQTTNVDKCSGIFLQGT